MTPITLPAFFVFIVFSFRTFIPAAILSSVVGDRVGIARIVAALVRAHDDRVRGGIHLAGVGSDIDVVFGPHLDPVEDDAVGDVPRSEVAGPRRLISTGVVSVSGLFFAGRGGRLPLAVDQT